MIKSNRNILLRYLLIMFSGIGLVFAAEFFGFFEGMDDYLYDMSFRARGRQEHDRRIMIAAIDEKTLQRLGRWPFSRKYYARFLDMVSSAKVVGFDIIMAEPSKDDEICSEKIKQSGKVVLPLYIDDRLHVVYPSQLFTDYFAGHVHVEQGIDGIVRKVFHTISIEDRRLPSFASVLYERATGKRIKRTGSSETYHGNSRAPIEQMDPMYINYAGPSGTFHQISFSDILAGLFPQEYFKDKVILVGLTTAGIGDKMLTPFTERRDKMSGIEVHANILNTLILQNAVLMTPLSARWLSVALLSMACFFIFPRVNERKSTFLWLSMLVFTLVMTWALFALFNLWISPVVFLFSFSVVYLVTYILRLERIGKLLFFAKEEWEKTFNDISDAIVVHDRDFNIVRSNKAAHDMLNNKVYQEMRKDWDVNLNKDTDTSKSLETVQNTLRKPAITEFCEEDTGRFLEIKTIPRLDNKTNIVGAIQLIRDITERKKTEQKIKTHLEYLKALRTIDMAITSSLDLQVTLDVFLTEVLGQLHADAADVLLLSPRSKVLVYAQGKGFKNRDMKYAPLKLSEGFAGRVAFDGKPLIIPDLTDESLHQRYAALVREEEIRSYFGMPLTAKGDVNGILEVFHRQPFEPDSEWLEFLNDLTRQAAIAIDNAMMFVDLQHSRDEIIIAYDETIEGWARALDFRDRETERHSERVADMTVKIGRQMGMSEEDLVHMRRGALLHDIGKLGVPDSILRKPGALTDEEWEIMRRHPQIAYDILSPIAFLKPALDIPYCHHEKWDGSGYPRGLKGHEIPVAARIFAVVDVWDALRSDRPNRLQWPAEKVRGHIRSLADAQFDTDIVHVFLGLDWN